MAKEVRNEHPSQLRRLEPYWLKTASVAGLKGDWVTIVSGYAKRAVDGTKFVIGVLAADWTNDTTNDPAHVQTDEFGIYKMEVTGATLAQATHVGNAYDFSDERTLDLATQDDKPLVVVGVAPDGDAFVRINKHLSAGII